MPQKKSKYLKKRISATLGNVLIELGTDKLRKKSREKIRDSRSRYRKINKQYPTAIHKLNRDFFRLRARSCTGNRAWVFSSVLSTLLPL